MSHIPRPKRIRTRADLAAGVQTLANRDRVLAAELAQLDEVPLRLRKGGFEALLSILIHQQVSLASAAAIVERVWSGVTPMAPSAFLALGETEMRALGLSRPKVKYIWDLCEKLETGTLNLRRLSHLSDADAAAALTNVKGIGPWTAEIYLLSCMGRSDAFPAGDLALQESAGQLYASGQRFSADGLTQLAESWRPWRSIAARILWARYRRIKAQTKAKAQEGERGWQ